MNGSVGWTQHGALPKSIFWCTSHLTKETHMKYTFPFNIPFWQIRPMKKSLSFQCEQILKKVCAQSPKAALSKVPGSMSRHHEKQDTYVKSQIGPQISFFTVNGHINLTADLDCGWGIKIWLEVTVLVVQTSMWPM